MKTYLRVMNRPMSKVLKFSRLFLKTKISCSSGLLFENQDQDHIFILEAEEDEDHHF